VAISAPAMDGPMTLATLNALELSAIAFIRSSRPTISLTSACLVGTSKAERSP
jgi:hypothetical protein